MGKKGGKPKQPVVDYFLSVHLGICQGPVDAVKRIVVKDKEAWRGRTTTTFGINARNLFGGPKKEGGVQGTVEVLNGGPTQLMPAHLASKFGRTPATMPAYRGMLSLFFHQGSKGFYWGSNNPYMPPVEVTVEHIPVAGLPGNLARISNLVPVAVVGEPEPPEEGEEPDAYNTDPLNGYFIGALPTQDQFVRTTYGWMAGPSAIDNDPHYTRQNGVVYRDYGDDANAAHIIFECLTNVDWGMGAPATAFDIPSFNRLAQVVFDERFGLSLAWMQQASVEEFVQEVLDHVQALFYMSPRTGLYTVKPIRMDYDVGTLRRLNPDNARMLSFSRKAPGEIVNEVVLTWTNPENEEEATVSLQALGSIAGQGSVVSDSRNYYGIRNQRLAKFACSRDLREASTPLASFEAVLLRQAWNIEPGECVVVDYPEEGIAGAVFRAMDVDYGRVGQPEIKVKFVEDVFGLPTMGYTVGSPGLWTPTERLPAPLDHMAFQTAPRALLVAAGRSDVDEFPETAVMILGATAEADTDRFTVLGEDVIATGATAAAELGDLVPPTHALLPNGLAAEFVSTIPLLSAPTPGADPVVGSLMIVGNTDSASEIVLVTSVTPEVGITVRRGQLDTVPRAWPANSPIWVLDAEAPFPLDPRVTVAGTPSRYKLLPQTSLGRLDPAVIPWESFTPGNRSWAPFRPANVTVGGQRWERVYTATPATIPITWANRNRLTEDTVLRPWTDGNVTPESGQTTVVQVRRASNGEVLAEFAGLEGTSFDMPTAGLSGRTIVKVLSERDGIRSIQGVDVRVELPAPKGYGNRYGVSYGR